MCQVWVTVFRWQEKSWSKEHVVLQPLIHWGPAWICYLGLLRISLRQKLQNGLSINFLLQNNFEHNKHKKEECHEPYISSFGMNNYKANFSPIACHRLETMQHQGGGQLISQQRHSWLASVFFFLYVLTCGGWREGRRGRMREKQSERLIPSWGTTIKTPCQPGYLQNALLPNTITLEVKGGHNTIHSTYA